jgi:putative membrane protein
MIGDGYWGGAAGWGLIAGLTSLAIFVFIIFLFVSLLRNGLRIGPSVGSRAIRLLEERYARGEISRDEFLERRAVLTRAPDESAPR